MAKLGSTLICGNLSVTGETFSTNITLDNNESVYGFSSQGVRMGMLRYNLNDEVVLGNSSSVTKIYSNTDKIYQVNSEGANLGFVVHSGLYGHGNRLDADTVDGRHWTDVESTFVKKAGDTMTGVLHFDSRTASAPNPSYLSLCGNGLYSIASIRIYADTDYGNVNSEYLHFAVSEGTTPGIDKGLAIYRDSMKFKNNVVWHAGNQGHQSGLDADKVDGKHWSDIENTFVKKAGDTMTGDLNVDAKVKANEYKIKDKVSIQFNADNNAIEFIAL